MKKIVKYLLILLLILYTIISPIIFLICGNISASKYMMASIFIFIFILTLYWIRYNHSKPFKNLLIIFALLIFFYSNINIYIMSKGIYMDPSIIIWMNGREMTKYDKESFTKILSSLDKYHAYIKNDPTYTINTMTLGDFDPKYLHIFKNKKLIYQGDLMDLEDGLELDGYKLTDEANIILKKLHNKY